MSNFRRKQSQRQSKFQKYRHETVEKAKNQLRKALSRTSMSSKKHVETHEKYQTIQRDVNEHVKNRYNQELNDLVSLLKKSAVKNITLLMVILFFGTLYFSLVDSEQMEWLDALHFSVVTISTVGYGDKYPQTSLGRFICIVLIVFGVVALGRIAGNVMDYMVGMRHLEQVHMISENCLISPEQIADFDDDSDGNIDKFEYLTKMLVITNEISQEKIDSIMQKFDEIDIDHDGVICVKDLVQLPIDSSNEIT